MILMTIVLDNIELNIVNVYAPPVDCYDRMNEFSFMIDGDDCENMIMDITDFEAI